MDEKLFYSLESGKVYPITPESRIDLINALRNKKKKLELKIRIEWEDGKNNNFGYYIVKVKVNLKLNLVIDYEDLRFLPPPLKYWGILWSNWISTRRFFFR